MGYCSGLEERGYLGVQPGEQVGLSEAVLITDQENGQSCREGPRPGRKENGRGKGIGKRHASRGGRGEQTIRQAREAGKAST